MEVWLQSFHQWHPRAYGEESILVMITTVGVCERDKEVMTF